jgi:hypothetical protein
MIPTPEEKAATLVTASSKVPGGPWFVFFEALGEPFHIGPYENPANATDDAEKIRGLVAGVIREEREGACAAARPMGGKERAGAG